MVKKRYRASYSYCATMFSWSGAAAIARVMRREGAALRAVGFDAASAAFASATPLLLSTFPDSPALLLRAEDGRNTPSGTRFGTTGAAFCVWTFRSVLAVRQRGGLAGEHVV